MGPLKNTLWINPWMFFYCITLGWKIQHYFCINDLFIGEDLPLWVWWRSNCCILNTGNSCAAMTGEAGPLSRTIGTTNRTDMETGKFLKSSRKSGTFSHIFITKYSRKQTTEVYCCPKYLTNPLTKSRTLLKRTRGVTCKRLSYQTQTPEVNGYLLNCQEIGS